MSLTPLVNIKNLTEDKNGANKSTQPTQPWTQHTMIPHHKD